MNKSRAAMHPMRTPRGRTSREPVVHRRPQGSHGNLVVVRAGRNSLHPGWTIGTAEADFDLLVTAYEPRMSAGSDEWSVMLPGRKIAGYDKLFRENPELLDRYEYIALFDDDIKATKEDINRLFRIGRLYRLDVFQPALSWDSYFSYAATLAVGKFRLRFTNTVEMMCPVFSTRHLRLALPLFGLGYETGIDLLWTRLDDDPWFRYAIIDDVVVTHTRAVGCTKTQQGFAQDVPYDGQIKCVLDRFGATFRGFVTYAAIDKSGHLVSSRYLIGLHSLKTWTAWRRTPMRLKSFTRYATDYTRHCFLRPVNVDRISLAGKTTASSAPQTGT